MKALSQLISALIIMGCANARIENITSAKTSAKTFVVTYDSQNAKIPASPTTQTVTSPATAVVSLPANPGRAGYSFAGWNTKVDGLGTTFNEATLVTANITVYAQWTVVSPVFTDNLDFTVTDTANKLIWKKCTNGRNNDSTCSGTSWLVQYCIPADTSCNDANRKLNGTGNSPAYFSCNALNTTPPGGFAGRTNWRVPSLDELKRLVSGTSSPFINSSYFPNTNPVGYWSDQGYPYNDYDAMVVDFNSGGAPPYHKTSNIYVRCVTDWP